MAVPRRRAAARGQAGISAATAATLSFLFPGIGQAYARRWRPALVFGLPALVVLLVLVAELSRGSGYLIGRLFDPAVALTVLVGSVVLGIWRAAAVVDAWRQGRRSRLAWTLLPVLLTLIVAMHGYAFVSAGAFISGGERIASGGDALLDNVPTPTPPANVPSATASPSPSPLSPAGPSPSPSLPPADDDDPYNDDDDPGSEEDEVVDPGPTPGIDMAALDPQTDGLLNVLIVGIDWLPGRDSRRTDTMIVVSVNTDTGDVYMFSFPRDIARFPVYNGGTYRGKLNTFAGFANRNPQLFPEGGMRSLAHQVGFLLGIPIDYYAAVDIPGFEKVVEAVGGVTINNEREINDHHIDGGRGFFLPVGEHRLSPADTVKFARSRKGSSDFARARRQQQVLTALRRELLRPAKLANLPTLVDAVSDVLRTDFPRERINELVRLAEQVNDEPTNQYVFRFPDYARNMTRRITGERPYIALKMDRIAALSIELFGEKSLYSP